MLIRIQDRLIKPSMNEWAVLQKGKKLWLMKLETEIKNIIIT